MHPALLTTATLLEQADVAALLCSEEKSRCCSLLALSLMLKWTGRLLDAEEGAERGCRSLLLNWWGGNSCCCWTKNRCLQAAKKDRDVANVVQCRWSYKGCAGAELLFYGDLIKTTNSWGLVRKMSVAALLRGATATLHWCCSLEQLL